MDWMLFISAVVFACSVFLETRLKAADTLMDMDARLAPFWAFGGLAKPAMKTASMTGGVVAAGLAAYDSVPVAGPYAAGAAVIFAITLYAKYFISARRSAVLVMRSIPPGWEPPTGLTAEWIEAKLAGPSTTQARRTSERSHYPDESFK
jgi:hypothetical protein